jgi:hypothetical protein
MHVCLECGSEWADEVGLQQHYADAHPWDAPVPTGVAYVATERRRGGRIDSEFDLDGALYCVTSIKRRGVSPSSGLRAKPKLRIGLKIAIDDEHWRVSRLYPKDRNNREGSWVAELAPADGKRPGSDRITLELAPRGPSR